MQRETHLVNKALTCGKYEKQMGPVFKKNLKICLKIVLGLS